MSKKRENRLFETNNYSIISKYSAIKNGYFNDQLLVKFIDDHLSIKSWRRTPIVNRGYAARLLAMDWIISRSIVTESLDCFIVLGAGFDTMPFRYSQCVWVELDLPQVVDTKLKFLNDKKLLDNSSLIEINPGIYCSVSRNYYLISCDLQDTSRLTFCLNFAIQSLNNSNKMNFSLVNEVCLCYVEKEAVENILRVIIDTIRDRALRIHYIGYEQFKQSPRSQFSEIMLDHFHSLGHPIKYFPTAQQIKQLFCGQLNFNHVTVMPMFQVYHNVLLANRLETRGFLEEPFDEFEEMDLYLSHYALVTGVLILSDPFIDWYNNPKLFNSPDVNELSSRLEDCALDHDIHGKTSLIPSEIQRFGHASCVFKHCNSTEKSLIVTGGFGIDQNQSGNLINDKHRHKRLNDCLIVTMDRVNNRSQILSVGLSQIGLHGIQLDRVHGQVGQVSRNLIFFNGGRQNPNEIKAVNRSFIGELDSDNQLSIKHQFSPEIAKETMSWRHRLSSMIQDKMFQVGGISTVSTQQSLVVWNLSSSKLGLFPIQPNESDSELLNRHSFGMDSRDNGALLLFGGLKTRSLTIDRPVESQSVAVLWDLRSNVPTQFDLKLEECYNTNIHFISDSQFVKIGGINSKTGRETPTIELIDLRGSRQLVASREEIVVWEEQNLGLFINTTSCHFEPDRFIVTTGGGGNYFTFGTRFTKSHLVYSYAL